jgi:hypothetical protein
MRLGRRATLVAAVLVALAGRGSAQTATPIFHGALGIRPAVGTMNKTVGVGSLRVKGWDLVLRPDSNGIAPTQEQTLIAIGDTERLVVPVGGIKASRNGKRFTFRDPKTPRGVRSLQLVQYTKGCLGFACYHVSFSLVGIDLSQLVVESPVCSPMAIIIGDDDGFHGVNLARPGLVGTRIRVLGPCDATGGWPWLS